VAVSGAALISSAFYVLQKDDNDSLVEKSVFMSNSIRSLYDGNIVAFCNAATKSETYSQIMAAIDAKEEVKRVRMAQILHDLHQLALASEPDESSNSENGKLKRKSTVRRILQTVLRPFRKKSVRTAVTTVNQNADTGVKNKNFFESITIAQVHDMIEDINNGKRLDSKTLLNLLRAAEESLRRDDTLLILSGTSERIVVVGDLHGCLKSLRQVLERVGINSIGKNTTIVFDGDFVDRGVKSLEVMSILLLLKLVFPRHVILLRGNHEDILIASAYGFQDEIAEKYADEDDVEDIFAAFGRVFAALPLCAVTETAAILHGGLPSYDFNLNDIGTITTEERCQISTTIEPKTEKEILVQGILWSDPVSTKGISPNTTRSVGVFYGPDVVRQFLDRHSLQYLIRGHEVAHNGFQSISCGNGKSVTTVFSHAAYPNGHGQNFGAYIELKAKGSLNPVKWKWTEDAPGVESKASKAENLKAKNTKKDVKDPYFEILKSLITSQKEELEHMFKEKATNGKITPEAWAAVMSHVLELPDIPWVVLLPSLAPDHDVNPDDCIDWKVFLEQYALSPNTDHRGRTKKRMGSVEMELLKAHHEMLNTVFHFLDTSGNGTIDYPEFKAGIKMLNKRLPENRKLKDLKKLFQQIDVDGSGEIDVDEFSNFFMVM